MNKNFLDKLAINANPHMKDIRPGDQVRIYYRIVEGERERLQPFEGIVIIKSSCLLDPIIVGKSSTFDVMYSKFEIEKTWSAEGTNEAFNLKLKSTPSFLWTLAELNQPPFEL